MKFAQINLKTKQMITKPIALPTRWVTETGATINSFNKLPVSVLFTLGWVPVHYEVPPAETHEQSKAPRFDENTGRLFFDAVPVSLELLKVEACDAIDKAASDACARYITQGVGQSMRYTAKVNEVKAYLAADTPNINDYPMLKAEAEAVGEDYTTRAALIMAKNDAWYALGTQIEVARVAGKEAVRASADGDAAVAERDAAVAILGAF